MSTQSKFEFPVARQQQHLYNQRGMNGPCNWILLAFEGVLNQDILKGQLMDYFQDEENLHVSLKTNERSKFPLQEVGDKLLVDYDFQECESENQAALKVEAAKENCLLLDNMLLKINFYTWNKTDHFILIYASPFIADNKSLMQITRNINSCLQGESLIKGNEEEPLQYIDYSEWQRELFLEDREVSFEYWQKKTIKVDQFNSIFKKDNQVKPGATKKYDTVSKILDPLLVQRINNLLQDKKFTLKNYVMAIWWKLLYKYVNEKFAFCYLHHGRSDDSMKSILGLFEKYLPLPSILVVESDSIWKLAENIQQHLQEDDLHQDCFDRNMGQRGELIYFPYQFAYYQKPDLISNLEIKEFLAHAEDFELKINLIENTNNEFTLSLNYDTSCLSYPWITRMIKQFEELIRLEIIKEKEGIEAFNKERRKIDIADQMALNPVISTIPKNQNVVDLFEKVVDQNPKATAIVYDGNEITYKKLNQSINRLTRLIQKKTNEVTKKTIGIQMNNPLHTVIAMLATLKSGNSFLPIDSNNPPLRTKFMLSQCDAALFITDNGIEKSKIWENNLSWKEVERVWDSFDSNNLDLVIAAENPCYLIFTSGSTGQPKGVRIAHHSLANLSLIHI